MGVDRLYSFSMGIFFFSTLYARNRICCDDKLCGCERQSRNYKIHCDWLVVFFFLFVFQKLRLTIHSKSHSFHHQADWLYLYSRSRIRTSLFFEKYLRYVTKFKNFFGCMKKFVKNVINIIMHSRVITHIIFFNPIFIVSILEIYHSIINEIIRLHFSQFREILRFLNQVIYTTLVAMPLQRNYLYILLLLWRYFSFWKMVLLLNCYVVS